MKYDYDLIVIGAGAAGLTAAIGGVGIGAKVLLVEKGKIGGDCTHYGCVPSKALIKIAKDVHCAQNIEKYGFAIEKDSFPLKEAMKAVQEKVKMIADAETPTEIRKHGVDVKEGTAVFLDTHTIIVNNKKVTAKKFVIATGAGPVALPIPGLADVSPLTNRDIFKPMDLASLIIIGSGPIGCELGQAFSRLGVKVTIITRDKSILSREDERSRAIVAESFNQDGVIVEKQKDIVRAFAQDDQKGLVVTDQETKEEKKILADEILVAVGRAPHVADMGLEEIGVAYDERTGISIDQHTRTSVKNIYAVGDVATRWKFTHYANHMAKVALTHALLHYPAKLDDDVIARVTFTDPEIASIGINPDDASEKDFFVFRKEYSAIDRAITDEHENGLCTLVTDPKGMIKGAVIVGEGAGELINEIALAMKNKISITALADTIHAYPTYAYGLRSCADQFRQIGYTQKKRNMVKKIFGLHGE